jgi:CDP-diacylglycerol---glycerol-3-phosphate 3-phosphatidyltransferase
MPEHSPKTLTDTLRDLGYAFVNPIGEFLYRWHVHPDMVTTLGCVLVLVACVPIAQGNTVLGAILLLLALPFDVLDGAVARAMQRKGKFGAVLDSSLDRYADGFIFVALSYYFAVQNRYEMFILTQAALLGTFLVSYLRARADGVGVEAKIGLFSRMERSAIIIPILLFPVLLDAGVIILAIGTNFTTLQRLWFVYKTLKNRGE